MRNIVTASFLGLTATSAGADCLSDAELYAMKVVQGFDCDTEPGVCRGAFALGAPESRRIFEATRQHLAACPGLRQAVRDRGVNHPDFYDAWTFSFSGGALSLSLKDKSALGQSFVVMRRLPEG